MSDHPTDDIGHNLAFVEHLYAQYLEDPDSVSDEWQAYFASWGAEAELEAGVAARQPRDNSVFRPMSLGQHSAEETMQSAIMQERLDRLVRAYRVRGHMVADLILSDFQGRATPSWNPATMDSRSKTSTWSSRRRI